MRGYMNGLNVVFEKVQPLAYPLSLIVGCYHYTAQFEVAVCMRINLFSLETPACSGDGVLAANSLVLMVQFSVLASLGCIILTQTGSSISLLFFRIPLFPSLSCQASMLPCGLQKILPAFFF